MSHPESDAGALALAAVDPFEATDPFLAFDSWMRDAVASEPNDPNAMTLATSTPDGTPSARMVLLKGNDARGFVFYTNLESRKGDELAANPKAFLLFHWKTRRRQIRIEGPIEAVTDAEADTYYQSRARLSRLGAWASHQSRPLPARSDLTGRLAEFEARYPGNDIPRPPNWSGFRVLPSRFEFWQDMPFRLHDRTIFLRDGSGWAREKLYP